MRKLKLFPMAAAILVPAASDGANPGIYFIYRGTSALASFGSGSTSVHSSQDLGSCPNTDPNHDAYPGVVAHADADQDSNVSLLGNVLSVSATVNCGASFNITGSGVLESVDTGSAINISLDIDSPFSFSIRTSLTQANRTADPGNMDQTFRVLGKDPVYTPVTFSLGDSFGYGSGPSSGSISGTLEPGTYKFLSNLQFQRVGASASLISYSESSHYDVVFSFCPISPLLYIGAIGNEQVQIRWSTNFTSFTLEAALTLPAASWQTVTNNVSIVGQHHFVTLDTLEAACFFGPRYY
jgi:hypothetical protein